MGKIIAVANQKGGVGKTTTAVNLASSVAYLGKKILLADTDPQGNATSGVGVSRAELTSSIYDCIINETPAEKVIVSTSQERLFCLPSNIDLAGAEIELVGIERREYRLKSILDREKDNYDYIFIDCPPSLGLITLNTFTAADSILIPIQCEYYALEGLSQLTNTIKQVKRAFNPSIRIEGVLATMFNGRTNLSVQVMEELRKFFPDTLYNTTIPRNVRLSEAPGFGEPIITYDITSKGAEAYIALAREFLKRNL